MRLALQLDKPQVFDIRYRPIEIPTYRLGDQEPRLKLLGRLFQWNGRLEEYAHEAQRGVRLAAMLDQPANAGTQRPFVGDHGSIYRDHPRPSRLEADAKFRVEQPRYE